MNILYIDHYAGSISMGMEFRPYYFAKEWKSMGHNVRIVAANFSHLRKYNPEISNDFEIKEIDGVEFQLVKTREYEGNGVSRALTMYEFCSKLIHSAKSIVSSFNPDVVITSSTYPLDTFVGQKIKKVSKKKVLLVHEIHDMWPITPIELYGMSKYHPFVMAMQVGENSFCKHSDLVVSVLPCCEEYLKEHGLKDNSFRFVSNGIVLEDWEKPKELPKDLIDILNKAKEENKFIIGFFGSHTKSYSIDYLLKAVSEIKDKDIFLMFVGSGGYKEELIKLAKELNLPTDSYSFYGPIEKQAIPTLISKIDASYVGAIKNRMFRFGIGMNKLFDAMMGGKPIIYAVDAPNNMVEDYKCGVCCEAEDVKSLKDGILRLINTSKEERDLMGLNGHNAMINEYSYKALSRKFIDILEEKIKGEN